MTHRSLSVLVVGALIAFAASGCGARWSDDQQAAVEARHQALTSGSGASGDGTAAGDVSSSGGPETTITTGPASGPGGATDGTGSGAGSGPATGGPTGGGAGAASLPCSAASSEKGVSATELTVGEISSLTGPAPGLGTSSAAAVRAYVAYRNSTGGVCGRKVVLKEADDGTDSSRYRSALTSLAPHVLGISGGFAVGDIGSESVITQLGIPIVDAPTGRTGDLPLVFDINPPYPKPNMLVGKYKYLYDHGARTVSMTYLGVDQSRLEANIQRHLMEAAGLKIVNVDELPLATLSYDSAARKAANSGANYLWFIADTNGQASMARSVRDTGFKWLYKEFSYTSYGTSFIDLAGTAAEGVTSWLRSLPTEEAASNPAMKTYVDWMNRIAPGVAQDLFSIDSWVSVKVFFESLEALPGPITRAALVHQMAAVKTYDAGGMFAPISFGKELSQGCFMGMIVKNGKWLRLAPAGHGYLC